VIDGQGAIADIYGKPEDVHFSMQRASRNPRIGANRMQHDGQRSSAIPSMPWDVTIKTISSLDQVIVDNADIVLKALTAPTSAAPKPKASWPRSTIRRIPSMIGPELDRIALLKGLGVRVVQLTYNNRNFIRRRLPRAGNAGLSKLGLATIARIEQEKLLLDLSHSGQRTVAEALAAATRRPTISHTGCRALHDNPRISGTRS